MMEIHQYTWIFAVSMVVAFFDAFGLGANDVANAFATSVSSGSLTLIQACIAACFTEFLGAVLMGSETAETIKGGILSPSYYVDQPEMLMLSMMCAIMGSCTWILTATRFGWPVSSTHSIVGAIIGVGIASFGGSSIDWRGVGKIVASWFISPIAAGIVASIIYMITKYSILRRVESFKWGIRLVPVYFFFTALIESFYIIFKAPGGGSDYLGIGTILGISFGIATLCALFCQFFFCPWAVRKIKGRENLKFYHMFVIPFLKKQPTIDEIDVEEHAGSRPGSLRSVDVLDENSALANNEKGKKIKDVGNDETVLTEQEQESMGWFKSRYVQYKTKFLNYVLKGIRQDVRNLDNDKLKNIHAGAEIFEDDAEYLFTILQVITALMASFAHGSNDVSNAVGPISSIYETWNTATVDPDTKVAVPIWILAYGGIGIDIGLLMMGYRVMRSMGNNITFFTPSRGFCAELSGALTVLTCSLLGLPVSTTHCITGATVAIGLCNKHGHKAVNWKMLGWCFFSWFLTLPCAGLVAGIIFSFCAYSPKFY